VQAYVLHGDHGQRWGWVPGRLHPTLVGGERPTKGPRDAAPQTLALGFERFNLIGILRAKHDPFGCGRSSSSTGTVQAMKRSVVLSLIVLAALIGTGQGVASTRHPAACFQAHHWRVHGTDHEGMAQPRPATYWRYVRWNYAGLTPTHPYFVIRSGLNRSERHTVRVCLGA